MLDQAIAGLLAVFAWPAVGFLLLGILIGVVFGAVPGLSGILGMIIVLPFTFDMDTVSAFALLIALYAVTSTSDTIASVMIGVPGTAASQATILDGYPMAKKGEAARAFGAAFSVSAYGGVLGALILALSLPLILPVITYMGSPEILMVAILGLLLVGVLSDGALVKGAVAALIGLLLASVGPADAVAEYRFTLGTEYLFEGLPLVPVVLGLFALPEMVDLARQGATIASERPAFTGMAGMVRGIRDAIHNWWLASKCAAIGIYVGIIPGLGAAIVDWIAYGYAKNTEKDNSFGNGDVRGVIAPEAANNATKGGSLVPALALGIPGSLGAAILLGALEIKGLKPGPDMLTSDLAITFSIIWTLVIANILAAVFLMFTSNQIAKLIFVPGVLLVPAVLFFVLTGSWLGGNVDVGAWFVMIAFGLLGYAMRQCNWPRPPVILGLVLGGIIENRLTLSISSYGGFSWLSNPIVLLILAGIIWVVISSARKTIQSFQTQPAGSVDAATSSEQAPPPFADPRITLGLALAMMVVFAYAAFRSFGYRPEAGIYPLTVALLGLALCAVLIAGQIAIMKKRIQTEAESNSTPEGQFGSFLFVFGGLLAFVFLAIVVGIKLALPLYVFLFILLRARRGPWIALLYGAVAWALLVLFYDRVIAMSFLEPWIQEPLEAMLPEDFPAWLLL